MSQRLANCRHVEEFPRRGNIIYYSITITVTFTLTLSKNY